MQLGPEALLARHDLPDQEQGGNGGWSAPGADAPGPPATVGPNGAERRGALEALRLGLEEVLPGLEIIDRDLSFEGGRADLVAVDSSGRLLLVLLAEEDGERAALAALDAHAFARENAAILARHLGSGQVRGALDARIAIVSTHNDRTLVRRLLPLADSGVEVYGIRTLSSSAGERSYLVPLTRDESPAPPGGEGIEMLLSQLSFTQLSLARELVDRMARLDEELEAVADRESIVWRFRGEPLVRVERQGEELHGVVGPKREVVPMRDIAVVERLVDNALSGLLERLGAAPESDYLVRPQSPEETPSDAGFDTSAPILTPDEIAAFRD